MAFAATVQLCRKAHGFVDGINKKRKDAQKTALHAHAEPNQDKKITYIKACLAASTNAHVTDAAPAAEAKRAVDVTGEHKPTRTIPCFNPAAQLAASAAPASTPKTAPATAEAPVGAGAFKTSLRLLAGPTAAAVTKQSFANLAARCGHILSTPLADKIHDNAAFEDLSRFSFIPEHDAAADDAALLAKLKAFKAGPTKAPLLDVEGTASCMTPARATAIQHSLPSNKPHTTQATTIASGRTTAKPESSIANARANTNNGSGSRANPCPRLSALNANTPMGRGSMPGSVRPQAMASAAGTRATARQPAPATAHHLTQSQAKVSLSSSQPLRSTPEALQRSQASAASKASSRDIKPVQRQTSPPAPQQSKAPVAYDFNGRAIKTPGSTPAKHMIASLQPPKAPVGLPASSSRAGNSTKTATAGTAKQAANAYAMPGAAASTTSSCANASSALRGSRNRAGRASGSPTTKALNAGSAPLANPKTPAAPSKKAHTASPKVLNVQGQDGVALLAELLEPMSPLHAPKVPLPFSSAQNNLPPAALPGPLSLHHKATAARGGRSAFDKLRDGRQLAKAAVSNTELLHSLSAAYEQLQREVQLFLASPSTGSQLATHTPEVQVPPRASSSTSSSAEQRSTLYERRRDARKLTKLATAALAKAQLPAANNSAEPAGSSSSSSNIAPLANPKPLQAPTGNHAGTTSRSALTVVLPPSVEPFYFPMSPLTSHKVQWPTAATGGSDALLGAATPVSLGHDALPCSVQPSHEITAAHEPADVNSSPVSIASSCGGRWGSLCSSPSVSMRCSLDGSPSSSNLSSESVRCSLDGSLGSSPSFSSLPDVDAPVGGSSSHDCDVDAGSKLKMRARLASLQQPKIPVGRFSQASPAQAAAALGSRSRTQVMRVSLRNSCASAASLAGLGAVAVWHRRGAGEAAFVAC